MNSRRGAFIVIESTDRTSRVAQYEFLKQRFKDAGYEVETLSFPRHSEPSSYFATQYLKDRYGSSEQVGPYTASLFFALDRYDAASAIRSALDAGKIVLANRFIGSNMAHQGTKLSHAEERRGFFVWLDNLEFQTLGIPRPDLNLILRTVPHADDAEATNITSVYDDMCQLFPKDFSRIDCTRSKQPLDQETINNLLWEKIVPLVPPPITRLTSTPTPAKAETHEIAATDVSQGRLSEAITNVHGNVYAFKNTVAPATITAILTRLAQEGGSLHAIIQETLAQALNEDEKLEQIKQSPLPIHQYVVVAQASALLAKELERGRQITYIEQPIHDISLNPKDENGRFRFYTPENFDPNTRSAYIKGMRDIFSSYASIIDKLIDYLGHMAPQIKPNAIRTKAATVARLVLPVAATSTIGIYATNEALKDTIVGLVASELQEANRAGQEIQGEINKIAHSATNQVDQSATIYRANTRIATKKIVDTSLPNNHGHDDGAVILTSFWPRNEMDIIADMLYEFSDQSLGSIREEVDKWLYGQKSEALQAYIGERLDKQVPGRALENIHYSWDILTDYATFHELQRHHVMDNIEGQVLSPRHGYDVPLVIEEASLADEFQSCFDRSLDLHSSLQRAGYFVEAQYATLFGHRIRWKATYDARQAFYMYEQLYTANSTDPSTFRLLQQMHQKIAEVHPLLIAQINSRNDTGTNSRAAEGTSVASHVDS